MMSPAQVTQQEAGEPGTAQRPSSHPLQAAGPGSERRLPNGMEVQTQANSCLHTHSSRGGGGWGWVRPENRSGGGGGFWWVPTPCRRPGIKSAPFLRVTQTAVQPISL